MSERAFKDSVNRSIDYRLKPPVDGVARVDDAIVFDFLGGKVVYKMSSKHERDPVAIELAKFMFSKNKEYKYILNGAMEPESGYKFSFRSHHGEYLPHLEGEQLIAKATASYRLLESLSPDSTDSQITEASTCLEIASVLQKVCPQGMELVRGHTRNSCIRALKHSIGVPLDTVMHTVLDFHETTKGFEKGCFRFRYCSCNYCDRSINVFYKGKRHNAAFIHFTCPEVRFSDYIPNHGYGTGCDTFYLLSIEVGKPEAEADANTIAVDLDRDYTLSELLDMVDNGKLISAYGGMSEIHRAHTMDKETYDSYNTVSWCEGGCGGCEDNWDYVQPGTVYETFPTHQHMIDFKNTCLEFLKSKTLGAHSRNSIQNMVQYM